MDAGQRHIGLDHKEILCTVIFRTRVNDDEGLQLGGRVLYLVTVSIVFLFLEGPSR